MKSHQLGRWILFVALSLSCAVVFTDCVIGGAQSCQTGADCPSTAPVCAGQVCTVCQKDSDCPAGNRCVLIGLRSQCATGLPFVEGQLPDQGTPPVDTSPTDTRPIETRPPEPTGNDSTLPEVPAQEKDTQPDVPRQEPPPEPPQEPTLEPAFEPALETTQESVQDESVSTDGDGGEPNPEENQDMPSPFCQVRDTRDCYTGPASALGKGECASGRESCVQGRWGPCVGSVLPAKEVCDGKDNDCDGTIDDGNPGGGAACNTGLKGECAAGVTRCQSGLLTCVANNKPVKEICNGKDDDCDGTIDDGNPGGGAACSTTLKGECSAGTIQCQSGKLACVANHKPVTEICNGKDDDCDGTIDEGNPGGGGACSTTKLGECKAGQQVCTNGNLVCTSLRKATAEICDGKDNDCDGAVDEGIASTTCYTYDGPYCFPGTTACNGGQTVCNKGSSIHPCTTDANCSVCGAGSRCVVIFQTIRACQQGP